MKEIQMFGNETNTNEHFPLLPHVDFFEKYILLTLSIYHGE